jgi:phage tail sheath protein FI
MPIQLSPGVAVVEKDFTNIVPTIASSAAGFAGSYTWGPVSEPTTVTSENNLVSLFGKPNQETAQSFLTAANFLSYSSNLLNVRVSTTGQKNAVSNSTAVTINNSTDFVTSFESALNTQNFAAKYPGELGNSLGIEIVDAATYLNGTITGTVTTELLSPTVTGVLTTFLNDLHVGDVVKDSTGAVVGTVASITDNLVATLANSALVAINEDVLKIDWKHGYLFSSAPGTSAFAASKGSTKNDELHIVVLDVNGEWTGTPGAILEKFAFVSKAMNAKTENGTNNFYKDVLNGTSKYVWSLAPPTGAVGWNSNLTAASTLSDLTAVYNKSFTLGDDDFLVTDANKIAAYDLLSNADIYQIAYVIAGKASTTVANYLIGFAETRKDVIAFISPEDDGDVIIGSGSAATTAINAYRNALPSSSFAVLDSGYKYQYDRYNDKYLYVPLNGDVAGLCARTDATNDPWFSPGGLNRGQIKNAVKLAVNLTQADRDALYTNGVNPVVSFPGQGVVLYGDKTLLAKPGAFDRIGVRRLFIILEKSVALAAKFQLFEFNDSFTQAQFKNIIEPFLRDIQGRRGINDFQVVCDSTNNTDQVVSSNNFVADIYIKPNYSINYITLNFIAGRQSVSFSTLGA